MTKQIITPSKHEKTEKEKENQDVIDNKTNKYQTNIFLNLLIIKPSKL